MSKEKVVSKYGAFSTIGYFPIKDQVIVRPLRVAPLPKKTELILPDTASKEAKANYDMFDKYPYQAIVVAVGPGFNKETPTTVRPGMRVYMNQAFESNMSRNFIWNKINYYKCQEGNIAGIADDSTDDPRLEVKEKPAMKISKDVSDEVTEPIGKHEMQSEKPDTKQCESESCDCCKTGSLDQKEMN
jgi:hypothetical protein